MSQPLPGQQSIDLVVACEVSSRAVYEKNYVKAEWPGGSSGVTGGIGYDFGYADKDKIARDWQSRVGQDEFDAMLRCVGVHGESAHALLPSVRDKIQIGWFDACAVFQERDVPEYTAGVIQHVPSAAKLLPDCLGVLFSLAYNRGQSWDAAGDRFLEMRQIKRAVEAGFPERVPPLIRSMKRLWPNPDVHSVDHGLRARRDAEAALFEKALASAAQAVPQATVAVPAAPAPLATKPPDAKTNVATAGTFTAAAFMTAQQAGTGADLSHVTGIAFLGTLLTVAVRFAVHELRKQPVVARAKDAPT